MARVKKKTKTKPKSPPRKRKPKAPSAEAMRSRKRRARERKAIAESIRLSERAARRAPKLSKKEQAKRTKERKRKQTETKKRRVRKQAPKPERDELRDALDTMRVYANAVSPCTLAIEVAPPTVRTLWLYIGVFSFPEGIGWLEIFEILDAWAQDVFLSVQVNPNRVSQIRAQYTPEEGRQQWANMSSVGPWDLVVSEAAARVDPGDPGSWSGRYKHAEISDGGIEVYLSSALATESKIAL